MTLQEVQASSDVVMSMLLVFGIPAFVLIDLGATHSFVAHSFAHNAEVRLTTLLDELAIFVPMGDFFLLLRWCIRTVWFLWGMCFWRRT